MPNQDKKIISVVVDEIIDKIGNAEFNIQNFYSYQKILKNAFFSNLQLHKTSRECVIPGCTNMSIRRSHSIPKSSVLENIATDNHLFKPEVDMSNQKLCMVMERIGINNASVFPGFCSLHENMFKDFESDGVIDDAENSLLQTYRSICRERVFREIEMEINKKMQQVYLDKLQNEAKELLLRKLSVTDPECKVQKLKITGGDSILQLFDKFNDYIMSSISPLKQIEQSIYDCLNGGDKTKILGITTTIDIKIPLSLCGYATTAYKLADDNNLRTAYIFLNVIPLESSTTIICIAEKEHRNVFDAYTDFTFSDPGNMLNMIESFMINGCDHWFICPDYWQHMPEDKQKRILFDILNSEDSFIDQYPISIFDDVRSYILDVFIKNTASRELTDVEKKFIKRERDKLNMKTFPFIENEDETIKKLMSHL
jgi:hypothetical protein